MKVSPHLLQHLGIVAGIFDMLGIGELIDQLLPKKNGHKIPHSTVVKAMIINGLGFHLSSVKGLGAIIDSHILTKYS